MPAFRPRILPRPAALPERAGPVPATGTVARPTGTPPHPKSAPAPEKAEMLLGALHNYKITASLGRHASNMIASSVGVDTGAGASVIRPEALPDGWHEAITLHSPGDGLRLRDANGNQLVTSGTISLLFRAGGLSVPCTFQVVANLSVPVLLGCDFLDAHAHAILPSDQAVRWRDGTASAIVRGPDDKIDRRASASRVLRLAYKTHLAPRSATVAWVRTPWGGLGQSFAASRLMTMHRATVANGVHEILPDIAFPVVLSNFGDCEVTLRPKTAVGRVEVLATGVIALPSPADTGRDGPTRVEVPVDKPSFCAARSPGGGGRASPAPSAGDPTELLLSDQAGEVPRTEGHIPAEEPEATDEGPGTEGHTPAGTPGGADTGPPRVADVPLPEAAPHLRERIRAVLHKHEAMWSGQALGAIKATRHHKELTPGAKPVRVPT